MPDRSAMVVEQTGFQKTFQSRNPHMRGTTSALRLLLGIPFGGDHAQEFIEISPGNKVHLYDMFALVNYLLCSAVSEDEGRRGKSTSTMRDNCLGHFKAILSILEPNVVVVQGKGYWDWIQRAFKGLSKQSDTLYQAKVNQNNVWVAVFAHPSIPDNAHNWGVSDQTPYLLGTVVPTINLIRKEILGTATPPMPIRQETRVEPVQKSMPAVPSVIEIAPRPVQAFGASLSYDTAFEQIQAGLRKRFSPELTYRKPRFEHSTPNRMRIYLDNISGSHYELCFRQAYFEFALHFESASLMSLERRQFFDPHVQELTQKVGKTVRSGPLENRGWMRVWFELPHETITAPKVEWYTDLFARFMIATCPILLEVYR